MVPAAGADCASWISENIVERSGGSSAGSRPFPPPMSPAVHGLWVRMMTARWRGSQASRMRCGTSRTSSSPISAIVVTPREMGDVTALPLSPPASRIVAEDSDLVPRLARVGSADRRNRRNRGKGSRAAGRCRPQAGADNRLRLAALLMPTGTRRTVLMLAACQALSMTGGSIVGLTGAIVGNMLTPDKALSTLPIAVQQAGVMAATIPAALLMARIGRRRGFWLGTAIGGVGAVIATWAIFRSSFEWFCFGTFLLGANRGVTQQYRFAAAEIADEAFRSNAISLVLEGGVVSAVFGAEVAKWSRDLFEPVLFAGCYALILVLFLASAVLLYFVELPRPAT